MTQYPHYLDEIFFLLLKSRDIFQQINANDDVFWDQFWSDHGTNIQDVFALVPSNEIRTLRRDNPANLATLCYKATERLVRAVDTSCRTHSEQQAGRPTICTSRRINYFDHVFNIFSAFFHPSPALNCVRLLTRVIPYIHEDNEWKDFFWSSLPSANENETTTIPLAQSLLNAICVSFIWPKQFGTWIWAIWGSIWSRHNVCDSYDWNIFQMRIEDISIKCEEFEMFLFYGKFQC